MASPNFSHIAACCRQAYNGVRRPHIVLESAFALSPKEIPSLIEFFYEDGSIGERLSDEDLREIFYNLTDLYPEEVESEPDLVQVLSNLSEEIETTVNFKFVHASMNQMFGRYTIFGGHPPQEVDNKVRSMLMRTLLKRVTARDAYWLILRLTRKANPFKHRDVANALAIHHKILKARVRKEALFTPLSKLAQRLALDELVGVPRIGAALLVPLPTRIEAHVPYVGEDANWLEVIRGERLVMHHDEDFTSFHDPNGIESNITTNDAASLTERINVNLPHGIYLIERVPESEYPLKIVDVLYSALPFSHYSGIQDAPFNQRRLWLEENLADVFIKPMELVQNVTQLKAKAPKNGLCFIHNGRAPVSYTNSREEVVRFSTKATGEVFRLIGGVWRHDAGRGLTLNSWRVAARDGIDGYYEVGDIPCSPDLEKTLAKMTVKGQAVEGELLLMENPTFVDVQVHFAEYGERGIIIQGSIEGIVNSAGISDVVPVEEVEWLMGGEEE